MDSSNVTAVTIAAGPFDDRPDIRRQLVALTWPVVTEQLLTVLTQLVDMVMVGHLGATAVAAVGLCNYPLLFTMALFSGIAVGATALVSRSQGAGDVRMIAAATHQSFWLGLAAAVLVGVAYLWAAPSIIDAMGADPTVAPLATQFLRWSVPGFIALQWCQVMNGTLRGVGDTRTPLAIGSIVNVANVVLGYALIYGVAGVPALGVLGSALGTTLARILGAIILLGVLFTTRKRARLRLRALCAIDINVARRLLHVGLPSGIELALNRLGMVAFTRVIAGLGTIPLAAHQIALTAESITYTPALGVAAATSIMVGQSLGARDIRRAETVVFEALRVTVGLMCVLGLAFVAFAPWYMRLFTSDPELVTMAATMLRIAAFAEPMMGATFVLNGGLRGAGDTMSPLVSTLAGIWLIRLTVTLALIGLTGAGLEAAWVSMILDWSFRCAAVGLRFRRGPWRRLQI